MLSMRCCLWPLGLIALSGCGSLIRHQVDQEIRDIAAKNGEDAASCGLVKSLPPPPPPVEAIGSATVRERPDPPLPNGRGSDFVGAGELQQVVYQPEKLPQIEKDKLPPIQLRLPIP